MLRLFIDNRPTNLLKTQQGKQGTYLGTGKANKFGIPSVLVDNAVLPDGHEHSFTLGVDAESAVPFVLKPYDADPKKPGVAKFGTDMLVTVAGEERKAMLVITENPDGTRRIKAGVVKPGTGGGTPAPKSASDIFA